MVEFNNERVEEILHKETPKTEELPTILRGIYVRYMRLYENYFTDTEALDDDKIAELKAYSEETRNLIKYYYMDIPYDICAGLFTFDEEYSVKLLGSDRHKYLLDGYSYYKSVNKNKNKSEEDLKAEYTKQVLTGFYKTMDSIFRESFGTKSKSYEQTANWLKNLLFGERQ